MAYLQPYDSDFDDDDYEADIEMVIRMRHSFASIGVESESLPSSPEKISKDELSFVEDVPKQIEIECPVCLNILTNPHQVSCCGKNFCGSCIEKVKDNNGSCPMCNVGHSNYQSFPDKNISRIINGLQVYCTNKVEGCQWKGDLKYLPTHLNKGKRYGDCQFQEVKCQYDKCQTSDQRQYLIIHEEDQCYQRPYICQHCYAEGKYFHIIEEHVAVCSKYPTTCPNFCTSSVMPRDSVRDHLSQCPLEPVDCVFSWAGCNDKPLREDVHVHTADTKHMTLLAVACGQLKKENEQMKEEMKKLNEKIEEMKKENEKYKPNYGGGVWYQGNYSYEDRNYSETEEGF